MIRASSSHRVCTNRPFFDKMELEKATDILKNKVQEKLKTDYNPDKLIDYSETNGIMLVARDVIKLQKDYTNSVEDPLPDGAKTYLQELWLENNYKFFDASLLEGTFSLQKGRYCEDGAISIISQLNNTEYIKNTERISKGFLTGECDIKYHDIIRDCKVPETWKSFKNKTGIDSVYKWQLISYCHLYDALDAFLDYVLMPTPPELLELATRNLSAYELEAFYTSEEAIKNLTLQQRIKTYKLENNMPEDIIFLKSRTEKSEVYYNSLTYEICMNI
jgi:hypothetical protein